MPIFVCGINHKTAPLAIREQVIFSLEKLPLYLNDLRTNENIQEAVILSTCNRSELYCDVDAADRLLEWFCRQHQLTYTELQSVMYIYEGQAAVAHMMQVACGLDSMILGEPQILGQMKEAFSESCAAGTVGPLFNKLFQQIFAVAKEVRTHTAIGACPVSVASTAVSLAKKCLPEISSVNILLLGAGDTIDLVLRYLKPESGENIVIANRNKQNAANLAKKYNAKVISFSDLIDALSFVDLVVSATGSTQPIVTKKMMEAVLLKRKGKALTIIDIAVPRDIDPLVGELSTINLHCIDDLKETIQHNLHGREHAAEKAREVIHQRSKDFVAWLNSLELVATTIKAYRKQIEEISHAELAKATRQLQRGDDPMHVLAAFAYAFTNKLLHSPSVQLRQAGVEGRIDILQMAQQLFAITQPESELI